MEIRMTHREREQMRDDILGVVISTFAQLFVLTELDMSKGQLALYCTDRRRMCKMNKYLHHRFMLKYL